MIESIVESSTEAVLNVARTERIRVLHVDDDQAFLKVAKQCLEMQGEIEVDTVSSVNEASEKLKKTDYDAVVCDYQMPGKDGLEFLKELRAGGNTIPFIVFTGKGREEVAIKALNLGADQYVDKHGDPETVYCELAHAIRQAVGRRSAQIELLKREAKLHAILESSPEAITITGLEGNVVECNQAAVEMHGGQSRKDLMGKNALGLMAERDREKAIQNLKKTIEQGSVKNVEYALVTGDGREFSAELSASVVRGASGKPEYLVAITRDITERKKAEEQLRANALILENIADSVIVTDLEGRITSWNEGASKIFGFSAEEMLGENIAKVSKPKERGQVASAQLEQVRKGVLFLGEWEGVRKDGESVWLMLTTKLLRNSQGENVGMIGVGKDISELRKVEKLVCASEERYRSYIEVTGQLGWTTNANGEIEEDIPAWRKFTGQSYEEVKGLGWTKALHPDDLEHTTQVWEDAVATKNAYEVEYRIRRYDGVYRNFLAHGVPVSNEDGSIQEWVGTCIDITERQKMEQQLRIKEAAVASSINGVAFADLEGKLTYVNSSFLEIWGYANDKEVLGRPAEDFWSSKENAVEVMKVEHKGGWVGDLMAKKKDGSTFKVQLSASMVKDKTGKPSCLMGSFLDVTERRKAGQSLKESEEKYRSLVELAPDGIMAVNAEGIITSANRSFLTLVGYDSEEGIVGKPFTELMTMRREDLPGFQGMFKSLMKGESPSPTEFLYARRDGTSRWAEVHPSLMIKDGNPVGAQVIMRDITERKNAEKMLQESEERFRAIFEGAGDGIIGADVKARRFFFANPRICEITGYSLEELLKLGVGDIVPKKDLPFVIDSFTKQMQGKLTLSKDVPVLRKDGRVVYCDVNSKPMKIGSQEYLVGFFRDVTELRKAGEALKDAKQKWTSLTENTDDIVMIVDTEGVIQYINRTIPPHTPEGTIGKTVYEYVPREQHDTMRSSLTKTFETGAPLDYVVSSNIPKIGTMWFNTKVVPVKHDGKVSGAILISSNITDHKKAEEERREIMKKVQMMNEKLRVVGGLTRHDVNNKLAAVTGNVYLARKKLPGNSGVLDYLKQIEASVKQIVRIFGFAKAYEMLGVEELATVDVEKTVDEAVSLFQSLKDVKVVNDCHGLTVLADSLLSQLFYNLIDNSLKYGEKLSKIRVYYEEKNGDHLNVIYEDDGVGIPPAAKPKLFGEGYTTGKGSGYGLYLIKKMMEVYGWTISETGTQGKGARFTMTIPDQRAH